MLAALVLTLLVLLLLTWAFAPRSVPWVHSLTRVDAGHALRGEWLAPPDVLRAVKRDYLAAQAAHRISGQPRAQPARPAPDFRGESRAPQQAQDHEAHILQPPKGFPELKP